MYLQKPKAVQATLNVSVNALQQVVKFNYLGMVFTRRNKKIDTQLGKANAVLRWLYRSVTTNGSFQTLESCQF